MSGGLAGTVLERVHVRSDALEPAIARLRLANLLAGSDLHPPGLPPAAVLHIRRLDDPHPGLLSLDAGGSRPPPDWERAFREALERSARDAARPIEGPVPAGAEAVLFADRAELLACLAADVCDGTAWSRWWWRRVLARAPDHTAAVAATWLADPEHASAAMEYLAAIGKAAPFASTLAPARAVELASLVAASSSAPALAAALAARPRISAARPAATPASAPPWRRDVRETDVAGLEPEQELVVGVLLSLRRAPALARTRLFAARVASWRTAELPRRAVATGIVRRPDPPGSRRRRFTSMDDAALGPRARAAAPDTSTPLGTEPALTAGRSVEVAEAPAAMASDRTDQQAPVPGVPAQAPDEAPDPTADGSPRGTPRRRGPSAGADGRLPAASPPGAVANPEPGARATPGLAPPAPADPHAVTRRGPPAVPPDSSVDRTPARDPAVHAPPTRTPPAAVRSWKPTPAIDTELGGLFYLLNLGIYLELYADFTTPLEPGLGLNPWEFVELLGAWLLGRRRKDPVWLLLRRLARRPPGRPAGRGFRPPRAWRMPQAWLAALDHAGLWRWSAAGGVLRIVHPAGFPVVAVPRSGAAASTQLHRELMRLAPLAPEPVRAALAREPARPLARWVARLGAYARARLRVALPLVPEESVSTTVLEHRARVHLSASHVDVVLSLSKLPLELRFAGLDRTPGWIPAAGRYVTFHFE